ncbi:type II secretion system minor pseudopilin GspI [Orrella sp. JC864]|uniref:type II secretion system minor pseudopilin GspI n=1 Tax=Orrella sp. JC864 TaxID=3120298 RepID=UPI00300B17DE
MRPGVAAPGVAPAAAQQGFSLVEVLVALAIVAVALAACMRATGQMTDTHARLRDRSLALVSAENALAELRLLRAYPPLGRASEPCPQGALELVCERIVEGTANRAFRQITVRVRMPADGPVLAELRSLASAWQ